MEEVADEKLFEKNKNAMDSILEEINKAMLAAIQTAVETGNTDSFSILGIDTTSEDVTITMSLEMEKIVIKGDEITKEDIGIIKKVINLFSELPPIQIPNILKIIKEKPNNPEETVQALEGDINNSDISESDKDKFNKLIAELSAGTKKVVGEITKSMAEYFKKKAESKPVQQQKKATQFQGKKPSTLQKIEIPEFAKKIQQPTNVKQVDMNILSDVIYAVFIPVTKKQPEDIDIITLDTYKNVGKPLETVRSIRTGEWKNYNASYRYVPLRLGYDNIDTQIANILPLFDLSVPTSNEIIEPLRTLGEVALTGGPFNFTFNNFICKNKPLFDNVEIIETIGDGTCLIHSFLQSTSELYRKLDRLNKFRVAKVFRLGIVPQIIKRSKFTTEQKERLFAITMGLNNNIEELKGYLVEELYEVLSDYYKYNYILFNEREDTRTVIQPYTTGNTGNNNFLLFYNNAPHHFASMANYVNEEYNFQIELQPDAIERIDLTPVGSCTSNREITEDVTYEGKSYSIYKLGFKGDLSNCDVTECNAAILVSQDPSTKKYILKLKDDKIDIVYLSDLNLQGSSTAAPVVINPADITPVIAEEINEAAENIPEGGSIGLSNVLSFFKALLKKEGPSIPIGGLEQAISEAPATPESPKVAEGPAGTGLVIEAEAATPEEVELEVADSIPTLPVEVAAPAAATPKVALLPQPSWSSLFKGQQPVASGLKEEEKVRLASAPQKARKGQQRKLPVALPPGLTTAEKATVSAIQEESTGIAPLPKKIEFASPVKLASAAAPPPPPSAAAIVGAKPSTNNGKTRKQTNRGKTGITFKSLRNLFSKNPATATAAAPAATAALAPPPLNIKAALAEAKKLKEEQKAAEKAMQEQIRGVEAASKAISEIGQPVGNKKKNELTNIHDRFLEKYRHIQTISNRHGLYSTVGKRRLPIKAAFNTAFAAKNINTMQQKLTELETLEKTVKAYLEKNPSK
jgi:hypothetical protein